MRHLVEPNKGGSSVSSNGQDAAAGSQNSDGEEGMMEKLQQLMMGALNLGGRGAKEGGPPPLLAEPTFAGVADYIRSGRCHNIITMVGAGISTSAGIPDFRSPGTGLYDNLQKYNLPHPQAIFMIDFFKENPEPFFTLAKELYPGSFKPTICHYFLRLLCEKGKLLRHYTQNIDTLERVADMPQDKLVEAHGTFHTAHCLQCGDAFPQQWVKEKIFADEIPTCPKEDCEGVIKPDIVFFGESLPDRFMQCVSKDMKKCDLLIVMGTSLVVQPFASLANRVPSTTPRLYINLERTVPEDDVMAMLMGGTGGFRFDAEDNVRDVFHQATCDDGCSELADMLGWGDELRALVKKEHERIDNETSTTKEGTDASPAKKNSPASKAASSKDSEVTASPSKSPDQKL